MMRNRAGRLLLLAMYHGLARWLPPTSSPGGKLWGGVRRAVARPLLRSCGTGVNIERGADIGKGGNLSIGDRSGLGINAGVHGPFSMGANVMMGRDVLIYAFSHAYRDPAVPMIDQGFVEPRPVVVEDDVWIGSRVILLPGVRIGMGAIVGAGAVVASDVPMHAVVIGNPARIVRSRLEATGAAEEAPDCG